MTLKEFINQIKSNVVYINNYRDGNAIINYTSKDECLKYLLDKQVKKIKCKVQNGIIFYRVYIYIDNEKELKQQYIKYVWENDKDNTIKDYYYNLRGCSADFDDIEFDDVTLEMVLNDDEFIYDDDFNIYEVIYDLNEWF